MENQKDLLISDPHTLKCQHCEGPMIYKGSGIYKCMECEEEYVTAFGKIKRFLQENGPQNAVVISTHTGVSRQEISRLLREGRIEVAPNQEGVIGFCKECRVPITEGTLCLFCAQKRSREQREKLKGILNPKNNEAMGDVKSSMRFRHGSNKWE